MVGGFEKTFEIGRQFRNEGMDAEHLQDYTQMEFYWAYADYKDCMKLTEELFKYVAKKTFGTLKFRIGDFDIDLGKKILSPTGPRSMFWWVNLTSASSVNVALYSDCYHATTNTGTWHYIGSDGTFYAYIVRGITGQPPIYTAVGGPNSIVDDAWHHIGYTWDGATTTDGFKLYIDGALITSITADYTSAGTSSQYNSLIGMHYDLAGVKDQLPFRGLMDESTIYSRVLGLTEIQANYNSGSGKFLQELWYWGGSAWGTGGSSAHYNTAATVNSNISTFDATPDKIGYVAYLISDGSQLVELDTNQITYSENQAPIVDAGTNKTVFDNQTIAPFSDCSFSDPDGTVVTAEYKVDGEVDVWADIPQGGYGSLLEAVQAWTYTFNNLGVLTVRLQVTDDAAESTSDSLTVTVSQYTKTVNVKDSITGLHLTDVDFNDGAGNLSIENSPFTHSWDYGLVTMSFGATDYITQELAETIQNENAITVLLAQTVVVPCVDIDITTKLAGTPKVNFNTDAIIQIMGNVMSSEDVANCTVLIEIRKRSDDSLVSTLLNNSAISLVANVAKTFAAMAGSVLTFTTSVAAEYYAKIAVSGGTPSIMSTDTEQQFFVGDIQIEGLGLNMSMNNEIDVVLTVEGT